MKTLLIASLLLSSRTKRAQHKFLFCAIKRVVLSGDNALKSEDEDAN